MPGKPLSDVQRGQIVVLHKEGYSYRSISKRLCIPIGTISRAVNLYRKFGVYKFPKRSGRKRCTNKRTDHAIVVKARRQPFASARAIRAQLPENVARNISECTIRRRLVESNPRSYRPSKKTKAKSEKHKRSCRFLQKV